MQKYSKQYKYSALALSMATAFFISTTVADEAETTTNAPEAEVSATTTENADTTAPTTTNNSEVTASSDSVSTNEDKKEQVASTSTEQTATVEEVTDIPWTSISNPCTGIYAVKNNDRIVGAILSKDKNYKSVNALGDASAFLKCTKPMVSALSKALYTLNCGDRTYAFVLRDKEIVGGSYAEHVASVVPNYTELRSELSQELYLMKHIDFKEEDTKSAIAAIYKEYQSFDGSTCADNLNKNKDKFWAEIGFDYPQAFINLNNFVKYDGSKLSEFTYTFKVEKLKINEVFKDGKISDNGKKILSNITRKAKNGGLYLMFDTHIKNPSYTDETALEMKVSFESQLKEYFSRSKIETAITRADTYKFAQCSTDDLDCISGNNVITFVLTDNPFISFDQEQMME